MRARGSALGGAIAAGSQRDVTTTERIKHYILSNGLRPGDGLPSEADLCATLGVSRSNVREAMRTLAALDIVEVRHGYGTFVGHVSLAPLVEGLVFRGVLSPGDDLNALREVIEVRVALDVAMAEALVEVMQGTSDPHLDQLVETMEEQSARGEAFADADHAFHAGLASRLGNELVEQLVSAFWDVHYAVHPKLGLAPLSDLDETARAHRSMLRAAEAGDVEGYRRAVLAHYTPIRRAIAGARPSERDA